MKTIIVFILSALMSSIAFAESDLCSTNLKKIERYKATEAITMGSPNKERVHELRLQAEEYQKQGDIENCIATTEQALLILKQHTSK
ncbi:hypothetical protein [Entomomonas asaccharolytica]|uniref:Tetratricopeptide repeat protein n=1 Tax=Entomomonas asaccharolytica TaxID=2785331 RepID=A0A974RX78_9GAMM|nr:hypothetical protein [Entomomonas asaccharolytica]QQP85938.1 hypothetical protein JHT90_01380 [Entomomonas asaccharolytica]